MGAFAGRALPADQALHGPIYNCRLDPESGTCSNEGAQAAATPPPLEPGPDEPDQAVLSGCARSVHEPVSPSAAPQVAVEPGVHRRVEALEGPGTCCRQRSVAPGQRPTAGPPPAPLAKLDRRALPTSSSSLVPAARQWETAGGTLIRRMVAHSCMTAGLEATVSKGSCTTCSSLHGEQRTYVFSKTRPGAGCRGPAAPPSPGPTPVGWTPVASHGTALSGPPRPT
jgi:hypothetical protein